MLQHEIQHYLERFFKANQCQILRSEDGLIQTKLTTELDKLLMNRPFYWHYIEKTGGIPKTMTLTLMTKKKEKESGEFIHLGSPRLHQIFQSAKKTASFIRLYENILEKNAAYTPLVPWLMLNVKISYISDRKKDELLSFALHLITGQLFINVIEKIEKLNLTPKLPDYTFPLTPLIKPKSGLSRIKKQIQHMIETKNHDWAHEALERWQQDLSLLERFYEKKEKTEAYHNEKEALEKQYKPKINIEVLNGGLLYLNQTCQLN